MPQLSLNCAHSGASVPYNVVTEFDARLVLKIKCDWDAEKVAIVAEILESNQGCIKNPQAFHEALAEHNLEDFHWDWLDKAAHCNTDEYRWFFLVANETVQAVCIIYHPEQSRFDAENIFYVDYLATAFWNRGRPNYVRQFSRLATTLLAHSIRYATDVLDYRPGFCLHSLPKAETYYLKLGMTDLGHDKEKENLKFFEAEKGIALSLLEETYV
jgi:hypothetical protein